jgi:hypothetical protein
MKRVSKREAAGTTRARVPISLVIGHSGTIFLPARFLPFI